MSPCGEPAPGLHPDVQEEGERDGLCGLGGGSADRKEAETESQNSEQSGITAGESLDQSVEEEEEEEEDGDEDDHLVYLEEILARVHSDYYAKYDRYLCGDSQEAPDIRKIVPELKSRVLADVAIIFSGLHPTNFPIEKTREHYHATALGAKILTQLVLDPDDPDRATHLIAARAGTCAMPARLLLSCWGRGVDRRPPPWCSWGRVHLHWPCTAACSVLSFQKPCPESVPRTRSLMIIRWCQSLCVCLCACVLSAGATKPGGSTSCFLARCRCVLHVVRLLRLE